MSLSVVLNPVFDPLRMAVTIKLETSVSSKSSVMTLDPSASLLYTSMDG